MSPGRLVTCLLFLPPNLRMRCFAPPGNSDFFSKSPSLMPQGASWNYWIGWRLVLCWSLLCPKQDEEQPYTSQVDLSHSKHDTALPPGSARRSISCHGWLTSAWNSIFACIFDSMLVCPTSSCNYITNAPQGKATLLNQFRWCMQSMSHDRSGQFHIVWLWSWLFVLLVST